LGKENVRVGKKREGRKNLPARGPFPVREPNVKKNQEVFLFFFSKSFYFFFFLNQIVDTATSTRRKKKGKLWNVSQPRRCVLVRSFFLSPWRLRNPFLIGIE